jgi:hypothetical protein
MKLLPGASSDLHQHQPRHHIVGPEIAGLADFVKFCVGPVFGARLVQKQHTQQLFNLCDQQIEPFSSGPC